MKPNKMRNKLTVLFLLIGFISTAQLEWAGALTTTSNQVIGNAITVDLNDDVIVAGRFRLTVNFDIKGGTTNLTATTGSDMFLTKYDSDGELIWARSMGGNRFTDEINDVVTDLNGNIYITGRFQSDVIDMDPSAGTSNIYKAYPGNTSHYDIFVAKYNDNGEHLWSFSYGSDKLSEFGGGIDVDNSGNVYVTGIFRSAIDFDPGAGNATLTPTNPSSGNIFVAKYDTDGDYLWAFNAGATTNNTSAGQAIKVDNGGNIYVGGDFQGTVDFDPGSGTTTLNNGSGPDGFIAKYTDDGTFLWVVGLQSGNQNKVYGLEVDGTTGDVFVGGAIQGIVDFNPLGTTSHNQGGAGNSGFLARYQANGELDWSQVFQGSSTSTRSIALDNDGTVWCTGSFSNTVDFNMLNEDTLKSLGGIDIFVAQYKAIDGEYICAYSFGGSGNDDGGDAIATFSNSNAVFTGRFQNTVDFDPGGGEFNLTANTYGAPIVKLNSTCPTAAPLAADITASSLTVCEGESITFTDNSTGNVTTWDWTFNGGDITSENTEGPHTVTFNTAGPYNIELEVGDGTTTDIKTISITVNPPATSTDVQAACGSFTWIDGVTYTSSNNIATHTLTAANGCDSIVTLDLTINTFVTGTDVQATCGSFTWIDGVTYTSSNNTATHTLTAANGCDSIVTLDLTINTLVTVTDVKATCGSFTWIDGVTYTSSNNTATHTLTAANGCDSIVTLDLTISSLPIVVNSTVINDNCEAGTGEISIEANSSNAPLTYVWSNGETGTDLTHLSEGIYQVTISDTASCSITTTFQVSNDMGECGCFVYVANAFSPNGDGNNDFIPVRGECVNNLSFKIFNRWGNLVFETNKLNDGWDGYYKGELQNSGIYVYVLKATLENGETVNESGDITLLR